MDTAQWAQGNIGVVKPMDLGSISNPKPPNPNPAMLERKARPQKDQALNCPRCNSTNTKFCYYNNYSLSQPRYFCKTCRRYWTEGGSLRNVPVGGGSRKNKRPSSSSSSSSTSAASSSPSPASASSPSTISKKILEPSSSSQNPKIIHQGQDLNLAYPPPPDHQINPIPTTSSRGLNLMSSLMPMSVSADGSLMYDNSNNNGNHNNSGGGFIPLQEFKPHQGLSFSFEGFENNGYGGGLQGMQLGGSGGARMLFPVEDLKHVPSTTSTTNTNTTHDQFDHQHNNRGGGHGDSSGFWSGMLGGGSW